VLPFSTILIRPVYFLVGEDFKETKPFFFPTAGFHIVSDCDTALPVIFGFVLLPLDDVDVGLIDGFGLSGLETEEGEIIGLYLFMPLLLDNVGTEEEAVDGRACFKDDFIPSPLLYAKFSSYRACTYELPLPGTAGAAFFFRCDHDPPDI
jgi:hypothetical protein